MLLDDQRPPQRDHEEHAERAADGRQHEDRHVLEVVAARRDRKSRAGTVKTTPAATDSPAEPIVCTMLFSRIVDLPSFLKTAIERTAIGTEAETVRPARSAR